MSHPDIEESPAGSSQPGGDTHSRHFRAAGVLRGLALAAGVILFLTTLYFVNLGEALANIRTLGVALPIALWFSGLWHLVRTWLTPGPAVARSSAPTLLPARPVELPQCFRERPPAAGPV